MRAKGSGRKRTAHKGGDTSGITCDPQKIEERFKNIRLLSM